MEKTDSSEYKKLEDEIQAIKHRLTLIETALEKAPGKYRQVSEVGSSPDENEFDFLSSGDSKRSLEFSIGEYGMAWLGNIVLLFGISFLVQYLQNTGHQILSPLIGFISVATIYAVSYLTRTSYAYLSKLFFYTGHLLLFYVTLRLHFIQETPLIQDNIIGLGVLLIVLAGLFILAYKQKSTVLAGITLLMTLTSGVISNSLSIIPVMTCVTALLAVMLYHRFGWIKLVFAFIFLTYLSALNWLLNNPLHGNNPEFITTLGNGYDYIIACAFIFSILALVPRKAETSAEFVITSVVWNGLLFTLVLAIIVVTYLSKNYVPVFIAITIFCIAYSVVLQAKSPFKITASMYAIYGFLAMSVTFYGIWLLPKAYLPLAWQSLLVVSMALWFRSRFIVVMNTILFVTLMILYLTAQNNSTATDFSYMLVAFITARIINWKKERLNIKTEFIRNLYLLSGFILILISFYHAFPSSLITVSWMFAAILFFAVSRLLRNIKYRWLAIGALIASGVKLILFDLKEIDIGFRVLVFLFLAIISITVSIVYTKYRTKKRD